MSQITEFENETDPDIDHEDGPSRLKKAMFRAVAIILLLFIGLVVWVVFFPHQSQTNSPVGLKEGSVGCPIPLPGSARNIQYASYRNFISFDELVRFEAPSEDCIAHIKTVISNWKKKYIDPPKHEPGQPAKLDSPPEQLDTSLDASWFDVHNIRDGLHTGGGPSVPEFWVDTDRGIFYYRMQD